ncbi:hypothetical protein [Streptomyces sp. NPDC002032]|uniref:hypothetical protein n=2 Tax=unclassified Streptomyces TaxID=2593676 RepID=UPI0036C53213
MARTGVPAFGSVDELMDLLHAGREASDAASRDLGLQTAALLRRSHPFDKELQVAGLLHGPGRLLVPRSSGEASQEGCGAPADPAGRTAEAVRPLLGDRVARLLRPQVRGVDPEADPEVDPDAEALRQAARAGRAAGLDAGVVEDWRPVLELVAAGAYQL